MAETISDGTTTYTIYARNRGFNLPIGMLEDKTRPFCPYQLIMKIAEKPELTTLPITLLLPQASLKAARDKILEWSREMTVVTIELRTPSDVSAGATTSFTMSLKKVTFTESHGPSTVSGADTALNVVLEGWMYYA
jgi:hypothetical protein